MRRPPPAEAAVPDGLEEQVQAFPDQRGHNWDPDLGGRQRS
jgi:hypothetical protein